jgi:DNA-binding NarL/FixJ family response regulator
MSIREIESNGKLTEKEQEIVRLLVGGLTLKEIAQQTGRHPITIYEHVARIRKRIGARTEAQIGAYAAWSGLVEFDQVDSGLTGW